MLLPDWLSATFTPLPALLWVSLGLGLPWALALLPRRDWSRRVTVLCLAFAFGPLLLTAWMFILGTIGPLLRLDLILGGTLMLSLIGVCLAWRKRTLPNIRPERVPLALDERLLTILIGVSLVVRGAAIAFWPFTAYDALWVFGYEGRLYTLLHEIPLRIDYYPQFIPLQYSFAQLAAGGINDHAARAVVGFMHVGSILAVYVLGSRLFTRRTGLIAAALWALYPHVGEWARFGDLEIPLTFLFTATAAFFLLAWTQRENRRRYALIAGLLFGGAMWTKPTAGAFIWGVLLLLTIDLIRLRFDWQAWRPRFELAVITGSAALPLGAVWYLRNALVGHPILVFPSAFWLTQAMRSGAEFGWPLLALLLLLAYLYFGPSTRRPETRNGLLGLVLLLAGVLPSILNPHRMGLVEWALLAAGGVVLFRSLATLIRQDERLRELGERLAWALALALPYFVTWFYSYSYHYRLSFAIVPLLLLPSAVILSTWISTERVARWRSPVRLAYLAAIMVIAFPGICSALFDVDAGWDWLWNRSLPDDTAKYEIGNAALMWVVDGMQKFIDEHPGEPLVVAAPGVVRLPFFFPLADIRVDKTPTRWDQLAGVVYFVDSTPEGRGAYGAAGVPLRENQVLSGLSLAGSTVANVVRKAWWKDDGTFNYTVYELHLDKRFENPNNVHDPEAPVDFGAFVRYRGHGLGADTFWPGRPVYLQIYWQTLQPMDKDYTIFVHLRDADGNVVATWDGPVSNSGDGNYYSTLVWQPGEYIRDERLLKFSEANLPPVGEGYRLWIGMYDLQSGERLPVTIGSEAAGDGYMLNERLKVIAEEQG